MESSDLPGIDCVSDDFNRVIAVRYGTDQSTSVRYIFA